MNNVPLPSTDDKYMIRLFKVLSAFTAIAALTSGSTNVFVNHSYFIGFCVLTLAIIIVLNFVLYKINQKLDFSIKVLTISTLLVLVLAIFEFDPSKNTLAWYSAVTTSGTLLLGRKNGFWYVVAFCTSLIVAGIITRLFFGSTSHVMPIVLLLTVLSMIFTYGVLSIRLTLFEENDKQLMTANQRLEDEVIQRQNAEKKAQENLQKTKSDAKTLTDTKSALLNVLEDIEEEKNKIKNLAKDLEKFKLATESTSDHIVITDADGIIVYANKAAEKITGFNTAEILHKKAGAKELWGGLMDKSFYEKMWHTIKIDKKNFSGEIKNKRKNGEIYYAQSNISPVIGKNGDVEFLVGIERDVTKEKQLEKAKDEFLSVASHELRTPLTAIDGLVAMIRDGEYGAVNDELKQPLEDINTASERLISLVNDLLSVSRIEAGRLKFVLTDFDIKNIIEETTNLLSVVAKKKGLTIDITKVTSTQVFADSEKVKQILNNLIGNAIKFTDKGKITVSSKIEDQLLTVYIADTGIGMREEDKSKLFAKFQQLESGKGRPAGTGLGLYITKELCQKMGGDLILSSSQFGKGSTFAFSVPLTGSQLAKKVNQIITREAQKTPDQKADLLQKA